MITNIIKSIDLSREEGIFASLALILVAVLVIAIVQTIRRDRLERSYRRFTRWAGFYHPPAPERAVFIAQVFWALFWITFVLGCAVVGGAIVAFGG